MYDEDRNAPRSPFFAIYEGQHTFFFIVKIGGDDDSILTRTRMLIQRGL